ncbi:MAG TPA: LptF/LptG family permease [Sulfurovum sp.]|uniref:LptF/LptG family permease n=1 Tax=Sulfurovum sp. TaxID=1969726 RepID=UPI002F92912B
MSLFKPSLYFVYLAKRYLKNLLAILFGLSFAFAAIDYFQHVQQFDVASNYKILYIFYMWEVALGLLYPLAIVFALIMTKITLIKNNTMGAFHAFGYDKKRLFTPLLVVASVTYLIFLGLNSTEFSYAKDKASFIVDNEMGPNAVDDLFFKYNDTFVYITKLHPVEKKITDITIFKVKGFQVLYTINAPLATFDGEKWTAHAATLKTHIYENEVLKRYTIEHKERIETLEGYKPKIIESLYAGKSLNILDAYHTWKLLQKQNLNSDKIRAILYDKVVMPLSSMALLLILFFKLPFHARMMNIGAVVALALGATFMIWGALYGLSQVGLNGVLMPELTVILPVVLLIGVALYVYFTDERSLV